MSDKEAEHFFSDCANLLASFSRNITMLPLEEMRESLEHAEALGPIIDPTLYREYLHSDKAQGLKKLLDAALALKAVVLELQVLAVKEMENQGNRKEA